MFINFICSGRDFGSGFILQFRDGQPRNVKMDFWTIVWSIHGDFVFMSVLYILFWGTCEFVGSNDGVSHLAQTDQRTSKEGKQISNYSNQFCEFGGFDGCDCRVCSNLCLFFQQDAKIWWIGDWRHQLGFCADWGQRIIFCNHLLDYLLYCIYAVDFHDSD